MSNCLDEDVSESDRLDDKTLCYLNETICQKTLATCAENLCCCLRDGIKCDLKKSAQAMDELAAQYVPVRKDVSLTQIGDLERQ